jgi:Na+/proline symporter
MDIYTTTIAISILVYIAIGNYAGRGIKNLDDYYVAGRRAPTLLIVGTLVASLMSSTMFLGLPMTHRQGRTSCSRKRQPSATCSVRCSSAAT